MHVIEAQSAVAVVFDGFRSTVIQKIRGDVDEHRDEIEGPRP
jgi:hypothetical protein